MPWTDCLLNCIAEQGDLSRLQVMYASRKYQLPVDVSTYAARSGSTELLQWLRQKGCAVTADAVQAAVKGGHQEIIMYLHANCWHKKWDAIACDAAARGCHAVLLCWLLQQNCTFDRQSTAYTWAADNNRIDAMDIYFDAGLPLPSVEHLTDRLRYDGAYSSLALCKW
jgi:hypothetical protein